MEERVTIIIFMLLFTTFSGAGADIAAHNSFSGADAAHNSFSGAGGDSFSGAGADAAHNSFSGAGADIVAHNSFSGSGAGAGGDAAHNSFSGAGADAAHNSSSIVRFPDRQAVEELVQSFRDMGFPSLATFLEASQDILVGLAGPLTFFAPTEEAFRNYNLAPYIPSYYLLSHHIAKGLFTHAQLKVLPQGKKLDTIAAIGSLVVTSNSDRRYLDSSNNSNSSVYINGVVVSHPDLFSDGLFTIQGVDHFFAFESWRSTTRGNNRRTGGAPVRPFAPRIFPNPDHPESNFINRVSLEDWAPSLTYGGYGILALALRLMTPELLNFRYLTIFTLSDDSVFLKDSHDFVGNLRYHVVPNMYLLMADLQHLPVGTILHTLQGFRFCKPSSLVVTHTNPFSINHVAVKIPDTYADDWIVVHEIARPLPNASHDPHLQLQIQQQHDHDSTTDKNIFFYPAISSNSSSNSTYNTAISSNSSSNNTAISSNSSSNTVDQDGVDGVIVEYGGSPSSDYIL